MPLELATASGETHSLSEWARVTKLPLTTLHGRLKTMSIDQAIAKPRRVVDEIVPGMRFNRFVVIQELGADQLGNRLVEVKCDCGNVKIHRFTMLKCGDVKSCGCLHHEIMSQPQLDKRTHVYFHGDKINHWTLIHEAEHGKRKWFCRCDCGAERWVRLDNLVYGISKSCGCSHNYIDMKRIEYRGLTLSVGEWATMMGMAETTLRARIKQGMSIDEAIERPVRAVSKEYVGRRTR